MTRYYPRYSKGGFPELYVVCDSFDHAVIGEPKPYHEANDEAGARNAGTWGQTNVDLEPILNWLSAANMSGQP